SSQPSGAQGRVRSATHTPERSGVPSAVFGAGALMSGDPAGVRGTPALGYCTHCACRETVAQRIAAAIASRLHFAVFALFSGNSTWHPALWHPAPRAADFT